MLKGPLEGLGEAAAASEVSARGVFLEHLCKAKRCKGATATMSEIGEAAAASEVSARSVFLEHVRKVQRSKGATATMSEIGGAAAASEVSAWASFSATGAKYSAARARPRPGLKSARRLLRPKFLHRAYFSNTCAKYRAGSDATAAMSEIGGAAAASEVSARGVFLEHVSKVWKPWLKLVRCPKKVS